MYRDLGFIRVWGGESGSGSEAVISRDLRGAPYAYLVYPHRPIVAYLPQTGPAAERVLRRVPGRDAPLRLDAGCPTPTTCSPSGWPSRATSAA